MNGGEGGFGEGWVGTVGGVGGTEIGGMSARQLALLLVTRAITAALIAGARGMKAPATIWSEERRLSRGGELTELLAL